MFEEKVEPLLGKMYSSIKMINRASPLKTNHMNNKTLAIIISLGMILCLIIIPTATIIVYEVLFKNLYNLTVKFGPIETLFEEMNEISAAIKEYHLGTGKFPTEISDLKLDAKVRSKIEQYKYSFKNPSASCTFALFVNDTFYYIIDSQYRLQIIKVDEYPYVKNRIKTDE